MLVYKSFSLEALTEHESLFDQIELFELSLNWLKATDAFMVSKQAQTLVHCLLDSINSDILIAWPLVKEGENFSSLTSFYSAVTQVYFAQNWVEVNRETNKSLLLKQLVQHIQNEHRWHQMLLGPFDEFTIPSSVIQQSSHYQKVYSKSVNFIESNIESFDSYYKNRPSQLRNTIRRREKKLLKIHQVKTEIITSTALFNQYFCDYQSIYQQSWKGAESSFQFIEQVCLQAASENKLRMAILFVDDEPAAAQIWFLQQQTASIFKLAYTPKFQQFSVGSLLSLALSQYVINNDQVKAIEFGMGAEPYKRDWLSTQRQRITYQVFNHKSIKGNIAGFSHIFLANIKSYILRFFKNAKHQKGTDKLK